MKKKSAFLENLLQDRFSDPWRLLSETSQFLSKTKIFQQHEDQLRLWRRELQSSGNNGDRAKKVREEITELRRTLRCQGYDLSLAKQNLVFDGFRNDASLAEGFRRVVIFFADDDIYWLAGENNHIILAEILEGQMNTPSRRKWNIIHSKHYLWYRRRGNDLILSGSDTETKEGFERLKAMGDANSLFILLKLKGLR
ncbi:MAG: hypothetical protein LBP60_08220 [Spirochaetaceae bacterium]|jgi:hypothetical protein|nr:hypothetical protein [Spirochaetaceae bacterium]